MMILPTGNSQPRSSDAGCARAFTLVELLLVMALLLIVVSVTLPSLKGFFRGRNLDSEARRFLSLTRYAQSRAVSEGVPMVLWIDTRRGAYGLQQQAGYTTADTNALTFQLSDELSVETQMPDSATAAGLVSPVAQGMGNVPMIRFTPDEFIGEGSPDRIVFRQGQNDAVWIVESTNRLKYELQANYSPNAGR